MDKIPAWLGFNWWWLVLACLVLATAQFVIHLSVSLPGLLFLVWLVVQADWVKRAERRSQGVYWILAAAAVYVVYSFLVLIDGRVGRRAIATLMLHLVIYGIGAIVLYEDFERLSERPGSPAAEMATLSAMFFGSYYFQFRLHKLASIQRATASAA